MKTKILLILITILTSSCVGTGVYNRSVRVHPDGTKDSQTTAGFFPDDADERTFETANFDDKNGKKGFGGFKYKATDSIHSDQQANMLKAYSYGKLTGAVKSVVKDVTKATPKIIKEIKK